MPTKPRELTPTEKELLPAVVVIIAIRDKHGEHKPAEDIDDMMDCLLCDGGVIAYSISASSGHINATCSSDDCISFRQ